jgi:hypothetical protein
MMSTDVSRLRAADFSDACAALVELCSHSSAAPLHWRWHEPRTPRGSGYLRLVTPLRIDAPPGQGGGPALAVVPDADDPGALAGMPPDAAHSYMLEVVHNSAYECPQILLRGSTRDGTPLSLQATQADLARFSLEATQAPSQLTFVSPWVHPVTGEVRKSSSLKPGPSPNPKGSAADRASRAQEWLSLHPCNTRAFMGLLLAADGDASSNDRAAALRTYMRAWWSVAGAAVGALRGLLQGNGPMHHT